MLGSIAGRDHFAGPYRSHSETEQIRRVSTRSIIMGRNARQVQCRKNYIIKPCCCLISVELLFSISFSVFQGLRFRTTKTKTWGLRFRSTKTKT